jgi:hypothetical protein
MRGMYETLVVIHSWLRWLVLLTGLFAVVRAFAARGAQRGWERGDDSAGRWFVLALDTQAMIGIILYVFLSPYTMSAWRNMGEAMANSTTRFFAVEHLFGAVLALAFAHIGRVRVRRSSDASRKHATAALFFTIALVAILVSIPWPFMPAGRPWIRGL